MYNNSLQPQTKSLPSRRYNQRPKSVAQLQLKLNPNSLHNINVPVPKESNIARNNQKIQKYLKHVYKNHKKSQLSIGKRINEAFKANI
jgi:hypothetical protein